MMQPYWAARTTEEVGLNVLLDLYRFTRFSAFGATAVLPLLGAGSVAQQLPARRVAGLVGVAAAFHLFAYLHNDLCDLALDRGQPLRVAYPLVRGAISPAVAWSLALGAVPLAFALNRTLGTRAESSAPQWRANIALAGAFALMGAYNTWGKGCPVPPLTDALQGAAWALLLVYGAAATNQPATRLTVLLAAYELLLILMVNGVHGALRDLENDAAHGARTTAILFGARANGAAITMPPGLFCYALALQLALFALPIWGVASNVAAYAPPVRARAAISVASIIGLTLALPAAQGRLRPVDLGILHLLLLLSMPVALAAPGLGTSLRRTLLASHSISLAANGHSYAAVWRLVGG